MTAAAVTGKIDDLRGLKENVVVGRLVPAGTGLAYHAQRLEGGKTTAAEAGENQLEALDTLFAETMEPASMSFEDQFAEEFNSQDAK